MSDSAPSRPRSLADLFLTFTWLALQGFGGVLAVVQHGLVEKKRWLTREQFVEEWAVAQIMPGPNVVNLAIVLGARYFGLAGAAAALGGILLAPLILLLVLFTFVTGSFAGDPALAGALRGMGAVAAGLIAAAALKLADTLKQHPLGLRISLVGCLLTFAAIAWLRLPLVAVLPVLGGLACYLTYRKLKA